ncbi:hypothetical protein D3C84_1077840 [compost metagenome]
MNAIESLLLQSADTLDPLQTFFTGTPGAHGSDIESGGSHRFQQGQIVQTGVVSQGHNGRTGVTSALGNKGGGQNL